MFFENPDEYQFFRNSLEHYTRLANFSSDCLWEKDLPGDKIRWIDSGHKRVFGYQIEDQLICQDLWEAMIHPDERNLVLARLALAISDTNVTIWEQEYRFRNSAGVFVPVYDRACIVRNADKKAIQLLGLTQDISNRILKHQQQLHFLVMDQQRKDQEMLAFRDRENERLSHELFNNIGQALSASRIHLDMAVSSQTQRQENITKALQYVTEVIMETRRLATGFQKPPLGPVGILEILRGFVAEVSLLQKIRIHFSVLSITSQEISEQLQEIIYRIIQIQVSNIVERAAARASIKISKVNKHILLEMADDGRTKHVARNNKAVLITIKSRAERVQGSVSAVSHRKTGYIIKVTLPLKVIKRTLVKTKKLKREIALPPVS